MTKARHIPFRTCVGCGELGRKDELIRLVAESGGSLRVDLAGSEPGRGGYLHRREDCWNTFAKRGGTVRSFRSAVQLQARTALLDQLRTGIGR